ncbi:MAG: hypothetical protein ACOCSN_06360 [Halanaeroarchaeum sp.]
MIFATALESRFVHPRSGDRDSTDCTRDADVPGADARSGRLMSSAAVPSPSLP